MKKYPYIGQFKTTNTETLCLFYKEGFAINLDDKELTGTDLHIESAFKNITHEYLKNTWGVVESKEHAEFIIELAELHGFDCYDFDCDDGHFYTTLDTLDFTSSQDVASNDGEKQITIPLPPKEPLKNAGDNLILGCEDSKCDEWPCVGDEVELKDDKYNHGTCELVKIKTNESGVRMALVYSLKDSNPFWKAVAELKKPKTPEEELRDEVKKEVFSSFAIMPELLAKRDVVISISECIANELTRKYNITKKPQ